LSGKELSNSAKKQIPKVWEQQQESYSKYQQEIAKDANFLVLFVFILQFRPLVAYFQIYIISMIITHSGDISSALVNRLPLTVC